MAATQLRQSIFTHQGTIISLGMLITAGFLAYFAWQASSSSVSHSARYQITTSSISLNQQPEWLRADVKLEALSRSGLLTNPTNGSLGVSILDPVNQLEDRVVTAFEFHPWVLKVTSVVKSPPNQLNVEVEYRKPLGVLATTSNQVDQIPYFPISEDGVLLPQNDLSPKDLGLLPRIDIRQFQQAASSSPPQVGQRWTEPRVAGAIDIISHLGSRWQSFALLDIRPSVVPEIRGNQRYYVYEIRSNSGTRIVWGAAPGNAPTDEHSFETKLDRLENYIAQSGKLDSIESSPALIDVRRELRTQPRLVKKEDDSKESTRTATAPKEKPKKTAAKPTNTEKK